MSGPLYAAQSGIEPVSAAFAGQVGNSALYNWVSGCGLTYSGAAMTVDLAIGLVTWFGVQTPVPAALAGFTIVADPANPRWTWLCISSTGTPAVVSGTPAAVPAVPSYGDRVPLALLLVQAGQTVANNITYKIVKTVPNTNVGMMKRIATGATQASPTPLSTTSTAAVGLVPLTTDIFGNAFSIPVTSWILIRGTFRKTATAADAVGFGFELNATVVQEASAVAANGIAHTSASQQAEAGFFEVLVPPRETANYGFGIFTPRFKSFGTTGAVGASSDADLFNASGVWTNMTNVPPQAAITSVTIRAINATANNNAEVDTVDVYEIYG